MIGSRKNRKSVNLNKSKKDKHYVSCSKCGTEVWASGDVAKVTCADCVQVLLGPPPEAKPVEKSDKPRGWHFKTYFEHNGVVYSRGEVVTDTKEIARLRKEYKKTLKEKNNASSTK